tara:strand:- start:30 stop:350 length:321 start_codon:yes stop_codon:yes gene_type:complete
MDHFAIRKAYPNIVILDDSFVDYGLDVNGNKVSIVQSNVDAARVELNKLNYRIDRAGIGTDGGYPDIAEQLDQLYHDMADGKLGVAATTGSWYVGITSIKTKFPKP